MYVDCDSTLILYTGERDRETGIEDWHPNDHLAWCLNWYLEMYPLSVTVWSGGGGDYAAMMARMAGLHQPPQYLVRAKDPALVAPWDVVIDDELEFKTLAEHQFTPEEAILWFLTVGLTPSW